MGVAVYHLSLNLQDSLTLLLPDVINTIFSYGFLGVPIFFVISGFVIAISVGESRITPQYAGNFILRRSLRLDPTYWVAIFLAVSLMIVKNTFMENQETIPGVSNVLLHMFYLQDLFSVSPSISIIYWTLCLEVQFYLFYIFTLWLAQQTARTLPLPEHFIHTLVIISVGFISLLMDYKLFSLDIPGIFVPFWHYFLLGVLVSNIVRRHKHSAVVLLGWLLLECLLLATVRINSFAIGGLVTAIVFYALWAFDALDRALVNRPLLFLGTISYTLYLLHPDIGWKTISVGKLFLGDTLSPLMSGFLFVFALAVSIFSAYCLHRLVEKPSLVLCKKLKSTTLMELIRQRTA